MKTVGFVGLRHYRKGHGQKFVQSGNFTALIYDIRRLQKGLPLQKNSFSRAVPRCGANRCRE